MGNIIRRAQKKSSNTDDLIPQEEHGSAQEYQIERRTSITELNNPQTVLGYQESLATQPLENTRSLPYQSEFTFGHQDSFMISSLSQNLVSMQYRSQFTFSHQDSSITAPLFENQICKGRQLFLIPPSFSEPGELLQDLVSKFDDNA